MEYKHKPPLILPNGNYRCNFCNYEDEEESFVWNHQYNKHYRIQVQLYREVQLKNSQPEITILSEIASEQLNIF